MTSGLFAPPCPHCGAALTVLEEDVGMCPTCEQTYLTRMGYLIAIDIRMQVHGPREVTSS